MDLLLPDGLKALIRDRYLAGVSDALAKYPFSAADEDSLTGALGNSISMPQAVVFGDGQRRYSYQVSYRKIRGRGPRAPEKQLGADGIFQIEVTDDHGRQTKGLPFQSKKGWSSADSNLLKQANEASPQTDEACIVSLT
jgi:hypothetical protein